MSWGFFYFQRVRHDMEPTSWDLIKGVVSWIIVPIIASLSYFIKKNFSDIDHLKVEVSELKVKQAVSESQIHDIREDIKDLVKVVRDVEANIIVDLKCIQKEIRDKK